MLTPLSSAFQRTRAQALTSDCITPRSGLVTVILPSPLNFVLRSSLIKNYEYPTHFAR